MSEAIAAIRLIATSKLPEDGNPSPKPPIDHPMAYKVSYRVSLGVPRGFGGLGLPLRWLSLAPHRMVYPKTTPGSSLYRPLDGRFNHLYRPSNGV